MKLYIKKPFFILLLIALLAVSVAALYACRETGRMYTVKFDTAGGSEVADIIAESGKPIAFPPDPVKTGYTFGGWFFDEAYTLEVNKTTFKVARDVTLYAKWINNEDLPHGINFAETPYADYEADKHTAYFGDYVEVTIRPISGYKITANSVRVTSEGTANIVILLIEDLSETHKKYRFRMPAEEVTVSAEFELKSYPVTVNSQSTLNGWAYLSKDSAKMDEYISVIAVPDAGYKLDKVYVNGRETEGAGFYMPAYNTVVTVSFTPIDESVQYTVNISEAPHGTVSASLQRAPEGRYVYITAVPEEGYRLYNLTVNGEPFSGYFMMPAGDATVIAEFMPIDNNVKYQLTFEENPYGEVTAGETSYSHGEKVDFDILPEDGYFLDALFFNGRLITDPENFVMPREDGQISAVFIKNKYPIASAEYEGGRVYADKASAYIGELVKIIVEINTGYRLADGSVKLNGQTIGEYAVMTAEGMALSAEFIKLSEITGTVDRSVTIDADNGEIILNKYTAKAGDCVAVSAITPSDGYRLKEGSLKFNNQAFDGYFIMPDQDVVVTAVFERLYHIKAYDGDKGYFIPDKEYAAKGERVYVTARSKGGYLDAFENVSIAYYLGSSSVAILKDLMYFDMPEGDVELYGDFSGAASYEYQIVIVDSAGGRITADMSKAAEGTIVHLKVKEEPGYKLSRIYYTYLQNGAIVEVDLFDTFIMPERDIIIHSSFTQHEEENTELVNIYLNNRLGFLSAGFTLEYTDKISEITAIMSVAGLESAARYVSGVLRLKYNTEFFAYETTDNAQTARIAQGLLYHFRTLNPAADCRTFGNIIILSLGGQAKEDYSLAVNGVEKNGDFIYYRRADGSYGILSYNGTSPYVALPFGYNGRAVTKLVSGAFDRFNDVTTLSLGGVREIAPASLNALSKLESLDLSGVTDLAADALYNAVSLKKIYCAQYNAVYLADSHGALYKRAPLNKTVLVRYPVGANLTEYTVRSDCNEIAPYAFYKSELSAVDIKFVLVIGAYAFKDSENLVGNAVSKLKLDNVIYIGEGAFSGCKKITNVNVRRLNDIGDGAFEVGASNLMINVENLLTRGSEPVVFSAGGGKLTIRCKDSMLDSMRKNSVWRLYSRYFTVEDDALNGGKYLVLFETGGGTYINHQIVAGNSAPTEPAAPQKDGYSFVGWYLDDQFTTAYNFTYALNQNTVLFALFTEE